jgi:excisionase family DNA binding protein
MNWRTKTMLARRFLTTRELSEQTGMREATIQKRVERGEIDCVLKGNTYLFDRNDFSPPSAGAHAGAGGMQRRVARRAARVRPPTPE